MPKLTTSLTLNSNVYGGGKKQSYTTTHPVNSAFDTTFKVNNADGFKQIVDFKPDGSKIYNKFNFLVIANDGNQSAEIQMLLQDFTVDDDIVDTTPASGTIDFILHPGKYVALPTSKMFIYGASNTTDLTATTGASAGNKDGTSIYGVAYATTGPKFIEPPGYMIASENHGDPVVLTHGDNTLEANISADFFKVLNIS